MARILAIDYGTKRTGIAVCDPLQIVVTGLDTVETSKCLEFLKGYLREEDVECLVVGEPMHLDGSPAQIEPEIAKFISILNKHFPNIRVERQDERFTSEEAKTIIRRSGAKKKKRRDKSLIDKVSAVLILQDFLESKRNSID